MNAPKPRAKAGGFTLVEMMISIAVLSIIMLAVVQIMNGALLASLTSTKHMDADTQARMVLDRMTYDVSRILKRPDVDYYFKQDTAANNDQMAFFSESGGYFADSAVTSPTLTSPNPQSSLALIGYRINSDTAQLERLSDGLLWNGYSANTTPYPLAFSNFTYLTSYTLGTYINTNWPGVEVTGNAGADPNYQVIGDQVFRMEICFLTQDSLPNTYFASSNGATRYGNLTATQAYLTDHPYTYLSSLAGTVTTANGSQFNESLAANGLHDVVAIVVSIAVLNSQSRAILGNPETQAGLTAQVTALQTAAADLEDFSAGEQPSALTGASYSVSNPPPVTLPLTKWKADLANALVQTPNKPLGLPAPVASQIRFYQRFCYLNPVQQ